MNWIELRTESWLDERTIFPDDASQKKGGKRIEIGESNFVVRNQTNH